MGGRLPGEMLARAEADLEPERGCKGSRGIEAQPRQQLLHQPLLPGPETPAGPPAIEVALAGFRPRFRVGPRDAAQLMAAFSSLARSTFSQEKPPSASGVRPKWP